MTRRIIAKTSFVLIAIACVGVFFLTRGCAPKFDNRNPTGETFPTVVGQSLEKETTEMPAAFAGEPVILLIGYKQSSQFDIDRWLLGLLQAEAPVRIVEIPTIPGLVPTVVSGWIDDGMRSGIPQEDWGAVVTLYGDAAKPVAQLTGNRQGRRTRVIVLDSAGRIVWFDDTGYSARKAIEVTEIVTGLLGETRATENAPR